MQRLSTDETSGAGNLQPEVSCWPTCHAILSSRYRETWRWRDAVCSNKRLTKSSCPCRDWLLQGDKHWARGEWLQYLAWNDWPPLDQCWDSVKDADPALIRRLSISTWKGIQLKEEEANVCGKLQGPNNSEIDGKTSGFFSESVDWAM